MRFARRGLTAIIGTTLLADADADAAAQIILAFTISTTTFCVVAWIASWVIIATGLAVCALYVRRLRARLQDQAESQPPPPESKQPERPAVLARAQKRISPRG